uniref:Uncharacterized protein LOC111106825 n=1 Tax=Crassostrea virginica TaxID=6565 RepID=A0A8B8B3Y0_CRAVI|nr:uncharacterized protein LOC111106825 [Crassostrea virginica]
MPLCNRIAMSMQFPLLFALISRRRKEDCVFRAVLKKLRNPLVEMVTADFEAGAWYAIRKGSSPVVITGCAFISMKAVWTQVQHLGLVRTFRQRKGTHNFIKQLMALSFLPWNHVLHVFRMMEERAPPSLQPLTSYFSVNGWKTRRFLCVSGAFTSLWLERNNDAYLGGWQNRMN